MNFLSIFNNTLKNDNIRGAESLGGVKVQRIMKSNEPFNKVYNPGHPKADAKGFVDMPNVSVMMEMEDLVTATRSYEANLAVINSTKDMSNRALSIIGK